MAKTVYIAGLGLIGASMALGIKRDHPDYKILGYNRSQASRDIALKEGMIDLSATDDFASFAPLADIIILSLPIKQTIAFIKELANLDLKEGVIIQMLVRPSQPLWMQRSSIWLASLFALSGPIPWLVVTRQGLLLRMSISLKMPIISLHLRV